MLTVKIATANAAFAPDWGAECQECARILREAADRLEKGNREFSLRDVNGNQVGTVYLRSAQNG